MSKKPKPIPLFCAYVLDNGQHGNAEVLHPPIRSFEDVQNVEARILSGLTASRPCVMRVALLNWSEFDR